MNEFYTPNEVAKMMRVSGSAVRNWCHRGLMPHMQISGLIRIPKSAVDGLMAKVSSQNINTKGENDE